MGDELQPRLTEKASLMAIWMVTNLEQNLSRPIQVLLLLFRVPTTMPGQVNQIRGQLNADVQRPALNISTRPGIGSRHYCASSVTR
jgi:hypothetical protein